MKSASNSNKKKKRKQPLTVSEVFVRLPQTKKASRIFTDFFWDEDGRKHVEGRRALFIPCCRGAEVLELKTKIAGKVSIPIDRMHLFYVGKRLLDDDELPEKVFEPTQNEDSDEDLFRPRLFLSIQFNLPKIQHDVDDGDVSKEEDGNLEVYNEIVRNNDEEEAQGCDEDLGGENTEKMDIIERSLDDAPTHNDIQRRRRVEDSNFKLEEEMAKIDCSTFAESLSGAGYDNEGAFGALEEEDLCAPGLRIPRRARVRIMTLAGAVARRSAVFDQEKNANSYKSFEKDLLGTSAVKALAIDGDDKIYTTKAELQRAWEKKEVEEEAARVALLNKDKPKDHPAHIQEKIDKIRR